MIEPKHQDDTAVYPVVPNIDDQIIPRIGIRFDIFVCREHYFHTELGPDSPSFVIDGHTLTYDDTTLLVDGQLTDPGEAELPGVTIIPHEKIQVFATNVPTTSILVADTEGAEIRYATQGFLTLDKINDQHFDYTVSADTLFYRNGQRTRVLQGTFLPGDQLFFDGLLIVFSRHQFKIGLCDGRDVQLEELVIRQEPYVPLYPVGFPEFHRSPRIILNPPRDKVHLQNPSPVNTNGKNSLMRAILPPLAMVAASFATTLLSHGNPIMSLGMGGASLMTGGLTASAYFTNKKEDKVKKADHADAFENYMVENWAELTKLAAQQRAAATYHYPDLDTIADLIATYSSRLYEKTTSNADYLSFSLGQGVVPATYQMDYSPGQNPDDREARRVQDMWAQFSNLAHMPVTTTLAEQTLGLVGREDFTQQAIASLLLQIAAFHSYRDVQFIALVPENKYADNWGQWRWLPHFQLQELHARGIVHDAQTRDMILTSFYQLITKRKQASKEKSSDALVFAPHYVFIVLDDSWLNGHQLKEYLSEDMSQYGVSVVWVKEDEAMLPETVTTFVRYDNQDAAELVNEGNQYVAHDFKPMTLPQQRPLNEIIRTLAGLKHVEVEKNAIPESISFMALYGVDRVDELNVSHRWAQADTSKSLAVPLGVRGKNDLVYLNLHERAHGPHGLLAGTTGSGKSEVLQSYILSLAVNFAPEDVGFLPIDFKGGGMANLFKKLPHLLGSITNLDGAGSARALASIHAELQKRQRLFGEFGVNHINGYTKLYKKGKTITDPGERKKYPTQPLPNLFLISDEFAELKANEPDFMAELVSTARIGRSLGVHLILATQKPSGVVDDQIWSNSRFKIALKVQDAADSNEILKTPDAASITQPGRGYLQVGNNEIYELFQSAYSGATYNPDAEETEQVDERIWQINNLGQYELLTQDLSDQDEVQSAQKQEQVTELAAVVDYIAAIAQSTQAVLPDKPWLPALDTQLATPSIDHVTAWQEDRNLAVPVGMLDIPTRQAQEPFMFDLTKLKHTAIFSSPGFGKSTLLQTIVLNLAKQNSPEQIQFNLIDFGTNGLLPLAKLPHVADIVQLDNGEKLQKMIDRMVGIVDKRRKLFQREGVSSIAQYEQQARPLPIIVNVLDAYDAITDSQYRELVDSAVNKILRDGAAVGVYLLITANRANSLRVAMMANIETKIALYLVDPTETQDIMGRERLVAQEIVGRGQFKADDEVLAFQGYLPVPASDTLTMLNSLQQVVAEMDNAWQGVRPQVLPMVPSEFDTPYFDQQSNVVASRQTGLLPLGLALIDTIPRGFNLLKDPYFLIAHNSDQQLHWQRRILFASLAQVNKTLSVPVRLIDFDEGLQDSVFTETYSDNADAAKIKKMLAEAVAAANNGQTNEQFIYIADLESFLKNVQIAAGDLALVLKKASKSGTHLIIQSPDTFVGRTFDMTGKVVREMATAGIVAARPIDTALIAAGGSTREPYLLANEAYYFADQGRAYTKIRLPKDDVGEY
ncbi:type VII secretion protein EssC [Schleiferilactobacillus perolens]|uniref:FtsK domain-containing protein n=1 Tax=Schleiferilactobacillus perolens DSM 12744 TaxID=1423792 RepID=A0A0R1MJB1_9LACO|nr:type VII secretion protein EssC [Schleiferilactobacillus perolens]KRL08063.1 hypothetical protein FD09_GL001709 [Schleiferilactobacillus perolens DSM 12744]